MAMVPLHHLKRHEEILDCLPAHGVVRRATLSALALPDDLRGQDRISALPDDLRRDIVSRLPVKEAARTTALSRHWRPIWSSVPLSLYDAHLLPSASIWRADVIDRVLTGHPGPICAVHLKNCFFDSRVPALERWMGLLAARGVEDLVLIRLLPHEEKWDGDEPLRLPAAILRCANLRRLYLGFWTFPDTSDLPDGAGVFPHLEELGILDTRVESRDLDHMLDSSPVLKKLALSGNQLPEHVHLRGQSLQCVLFWDDVRVRGVVVDAPSLERLIMWETWRVKNLEIASSPELKVLGYLQPRACQLQIGDTFIKVDTKASPSSMIPSVKILALKVDFSGFTEVQMMASFLRCFPNIETLHVECYHRDVPKLLDGTYNPHAFYWLGDAPDEPISGKQDVKFYENISPIECVQSQIKKVVLHNFRGLQTEMDFLKYLTQRANEMQQLTLVLPHLSNEISVGDIKAVLGDLVIPPWASEACTLLLVGPPVKLAWSFHRASDLSIHDPFLSDDGQELFRFTKEI